MKLELKHLAPYLPYGLKCCLMGEKDEETEKPKQFIIEGANTEYIEVWSRKTITDQYIYSDVFPILRPLSDLLKEEDFLGIQNLIRVHIGKSKLQKMCADGYGLIDLPFFITDYLFENHFDFFDLIEKGLAIDINTLSGNYSL